MHRASILVLCALLGACASNALEIRSSSSGFASGGSVLRPLEDAKQHLAAGRNGLAIRRFGEELGRHPRSLEALNGIAIAYAGIGRYDVAYSYFERALQFEPRDAATLNNYGRSLIDDGRLRDARPFLEQALRYAGESDAAVINANMLTIRRAEPPRILTASRREEVPQARPRLIRIATDRHRLQTVVGPAAAPIPLGPLVEPRIAQLSAAGGRRPAPPLPPAKPDLVGGRGMPVRLAAVPTPELKPVWLRPVSRNAAPEAAPTVRPAPLPADALAAVRVAIERRIAGSGFDEVLDDIFAAPATDAGPSATDQGVWT